MRKREKITDSMRCCYKCLTIYITTFFLKIQDYNLFFYFLSDDPLIQNQKQLAAIYVRDYEKSVWKQKSTFFQSRLANADSKNKYDGWWCSETIRATAHSICHLFPFPHTFNPSKIPYRNFRRVISEWIGNFLFYTSKGRYFYNILRWYESTQCGHEISK